MHNIFRLSLCPLFLFFCTMCNKNENYAKSILGDPLPKKCKIIKCIEQKTSGGGHAIFLNLPKGEFEKLKKELNDYTPWQSLEKGRRIRVNENDDLRVPEDINGLYAIGPYRGNGLIDVIVWDESKKLIILIAAEATI